MGRIIACIDGSEHADSVCRLSSWVAKKTEIGISILHVAEPHSDVEAKVDCTGTIGLDAKNELQKELTEIDEAHGKEEQRKGQFIINQANNEFASKNITNVESLHRRGSLQETLLDLEPEAELIIMGKRGENSSNKSGKLGPNLENIARSIHKPLLVATRDAKPIEKFLIAYDGSESSKKALEYVINSPLLKGLECHLLKVCEESGEAEALLEEAKNKLAKAGFSVNANLQKGRPVEKVVSDYTKENNIDLLVIGAYGHSKIRSLILGSVTTALIHKSSIPVLLFR